MKKSKYYKNILFNQNTIREAFSLFIRNVVKNTNSKEIYKSLSVQNNDEDWEYDELEDFYSAYLKEPEYAKFSVSFDEGSFGLDTLYTQTYVHISAKKSTEIESVFSAFEQAVIDKKYKKVIRNQKKKINIFIGHGGSPQWRLLKEHLTDKHGYSVQAYEVGSRAGHTIRDILDDMMVKSSFACLVMTKEDEMKSGDYRARQNVIHEIGLFQGCLGFSRAIILKEEGAEDFSNVAGIQYIPFSDGNIRETFGDVLATIKREFK